MQERKMNEGPGKEKKGGGKKMEMKEKSKLLLRLEKRKENRRENRNC